MTWYEQVLVAVVGFNILVVGWLAQAAARYRRRERAVERLKEMERRAA